MNTKLIALGVGAFLSLASGSVQANFTINPLTYNSTDATKGVIWFDTVGTMTYDGAGNPQNVVGSLGNSTVQVDFVITAGGFTAVSRAYSLDAAANGFLAFGTVSGQSIETITSADLTPGTANATYQVRAWVGGTSYGDALNTKRGNSTGTYSIALGGSPVGGGNPVTPGDFTAFSAFAVTATAVPEPATVALGLFGAAGLFIRRRK